MSCNAGDCVAAPLSQKQGYNTQILKYVKKDTYNIIALGGIPAGTRQGKGAEYI